MKKFPENFLKALNAADYNLLGRTLKFMTWENSWPEKLVWQQIHDSYVEDNPWSYYKHAEDYYWEDNLTIPDWTPLAEAAITLDQTSIQLVLSRWPNKDIVIRSYAALNKMYDLRSELIQSKKECDMASAIDLNTITQAKILIRYLSVNVMPSIQYEFEKKDNDAYFDFLSVQIKTLNNIDGLISFYNDYIATGFITLIKPKYFFSSPIILYSDNTRQLITELQEIAHELIGKKEEPELSNACAQLLNSDLFSKKHEQYGVSASIRNLLLELSPASTNVNEVKLDTTFSLPKTSAQAKNPDYNFLSEVWSTFAYLFQQAATAVVQLIVFLQQFLMSICKWVSHILPEKSEQEANLPSQYI